jgi:hypothetical protein
LTLFEPGGRVPAFSQSNGVHMKRMAFALALAVTTAAQAHPVTYPGNLMTMIETDRNWLDTNAWYTFAPGHAAGAGFLKFKNGAGAIKREVPNLHYNYRLMRWNTPDSQANIYLQAGLGVATGTGFSGSHTTLMPGFQADYETRRIYTAYKWHTVRSAAFAHDFHNAQAGFAFYAGEYDEWSPWFILDVRKATALGMKSEVTPTLRLIHKDLFFEAGAVDGKRLRLNLMLNFSF